MNFKTKFFIYNRESVRINVKLKLKRNEIIEI